MITKEQIITFLKETGRDWKYTKENNIITKEIIYFIYTDFLCDIGINNLPEYQNWD